MKLDTRLALFAGLVAAGLLAGCGGGKTNTDGGTKTDGGGSESCLDDTDCPDPNLFYCNTLTSKCEAACRTKDDCGAAKRGEYALDYCSGNLGCQCDEGKCVASLCSTDSDCGNTLVCRSGACVNPPAASQATRCMITPDFVTVPAGTSVKFWASAWSGTDPLVAKDGFTWTPAAASPSTGPATTLQLANGTTEVTAKVGGATCKATVVVLAPIASGLRVTVSDELTGRPVAGTKVVLSDASGAALDTPQTVDAQGVATFPSAAGSVTVTAFHADYNYLTVANYDLATGGAEAHDLSLVIRRNQTDNYGGYKGTFKNVPSTPNIKLGIAGASIAGSITDLSITQLLGPSVNTDVKIGTIVDQKDVPLPAGVFLAYDINNIKPNVSAQGLAGVCVKADGTADEEKILAGTCGTRSAWAVAGDVPLSELSGAASSLSGGIDGLNFGQLLSQLLPVLRRFNSSVIRDVQFTLEKTPTPNGQPDFSNVSKFTTADHDFQQIPLGFNFALKYGELPKFKGSYVDGVIMIGGVIAPGRGVVPLGLGVGVNQSPADAHIDKQGTLPSADLVGLRMAPAHHGLEGSTYGVVALGASLKSATDSTAGVGGSALFSRIPLNKLTFDPKGATPVDFSGEKFLTIPESAKYNFASTSYQGMAGRTFKFTSAPDLAGVSLVRVTFYGTDDKRWTVLADPAAIGTGSFTLPATPAGMADRTFSNGSSVTGDRASMIVQTVKLKLEDGSAEIGFRQFVQNNGTNADRMNDFARAFALMGYLPPSVEWSSPKSGASVAAGSQFKLTVSNFRLGTDATTADGYVKVSCGNGANKSVDVSTYSDQAKGEATGNFPAGCTGTGPVTATLMNVDQSPVQPAAVFTTTLTFP